MKREEIAARKTELFDIIQTANADLDELRKTCPHPETKKGIWQWRIGSTYNALICVDCGDVIENLDYSPSTILAK